MRRSWSRWFFVGLSGLGVGCSSSDGQRPVEAKPPSTVISEGVCQVTGQGDPVAFLPTIGCLADFTALASIPIDTTLPGARSVKVVYDQAQNGALYFQNSTQYEVHYQFVSSHLSGNGLPVVSALAEFNTTEYFSATRRFVLGAVTYYEGAKIWALELSPYDTASAAMTSALFQAVKAHSYFGPALAFHPTSDAIYTMAQKLAGDIPRVTTDDLYAQIDYQPLTLAKGIGRLRFMKAAELETQYLSYQTLVVLDEVPNDISVVQGIITEEFQTPLSHLNVLSRNRQTPNMALKNAFTHERLLAYKDKLVELTVGASDWAIREVTLDEAQAFWTVHRPAAVTFPAMDLDERELLDIEAVSPEQSDRTLRDSIKRGVLAFGGKAAQYAVLARTEGVPVKKAFGIPVYYYWAFMKNNGFYDRIDALMADERFVTDHETRDKALLALRTDMLSAPLEPELEEKLSEKLIQDYPGLVMRFRTSTNSEDLEGFPCAGCYESHTGDPAHWKEVQKAIRKTYASTWLFRTYEERTYYGVDHKTVSMALLVHQNFPDEEANGVAVTANPFDATGVDPAFYVNVQYRGYAEVVHPPKGVKSDQILYFFSQPNQPTSYLAHSNLIPIGTTVLSRAQLYELGTALTAIHNRFSYAYGSGIGNLGWYAMDVEFKFDNQANPTKTPSLFIKQARPYPKSAVSE